MSHPLRRLVLSACLLCLWNSHAGAAGAGAEASATVVEPVAIKQERSLDFGAIVPGRTAGSITLAPDGSRRFGGGAKSPESTPGEVALFKISSAADANFSISLPESVTVTRAGDDAAPMSITSWTRARVQADATPAADGEVFAVGGTLHVGPNQAPGLYSGVFNIGVDYD